METITCPECKEELLLIPDVQAMKTALQNHVDTHKELTVEKKERLESNLITRVFMVITKEMKEWQQHQLQSKNLTTNREKVKKGELKEKERVKLKSNVFFLQVMHRT